MSPARRSLLLVTLGVAALALVWFAPPPDPVVQPVAARAAPGDTVTRDASGRLPPLRTWPARVDWPPLPRADAPPATLRDGDRPADTGNPRATAPKPAAVAAPALPFRFLGRLLVEDQVAVFLAAGGDTVTARAGAELQAGWRLDRVELDHLEFTHLPTQTSRSLTISPP